MLSFQPLHDHKAKLNNYMENIYLDVVGSHVLKNFNETLWGDFLTIVSYCLFSPVLGKPSFSRAWPGHSCWVGPMHNSRPAFTPPVWLCHTFVSPTSAKVYTNFPVTMATRGSPASASPRRRHFPAGLINRGCLAVSPARGLIRGRVIFWKKSGWRVRTFFISIKEKWALWVWVNAGWPFA